MAEAPVRCLKCGLLQASRSLEGLCAACLLESSLEPDPEPEEPSVDVEWLNRRGLGTSRPTTVKGRRFGEYELEGEVARGGMGIIYRARHLRLNRVVALKMILPGPLATPDFLARFQNEARAAATLDHPNVVSIHEVGEVEGQPYYTMRLIEGLDLAKELARGGAMSPRRAAEIMARVARAVHYAHQRGVLHRDLKPANILLDGEGRPHVTDFGLAKLVEEDQGLTLSSASLGTPSYMSPEQAAGHARDVTTAADIYSLGAILFEALTGERLFAAPTPLGTIKQVLEQEARPASSLNRSVPADLDTICLKCLEKEPYRRYRTALEMAEDLEHWLAGEPIRARPVRWVERMWLWCRRRPALAGLAGASMAVLMVVSALAVWRVRAARQQEDLERYAANISLADGAIKAGSIDRALDYLERCPEDQRHWEWGRLLFECFQDVNTIPAHTNRPQYLMRPLLESFAFDGQGSHVATTGQDGSLAIWDSLEGREFFRIGDPTNRVTSFAFRPGESQVAVGRLDGSVNLLDVESGAVIVRLIEPHAEVPAGLPDPIVGTNYDIYDWGPIRDPLQRRPWAITGLAWDPRGARIAVVRADGDVAVGSTGTNRSEWLELLVELGQVRGAWFTPDGTEIVALSPGSAQRFDAQTSKLTAVLRWDPSSSGAVSPGGDRAVVIDPSGRTSLVAPDGVVADLGRLALRNQNAPLVAFFSPDGALFCTTGDAGTARVFRADTGEVLFPLPDTVYGGAFSANGNQVAVFGSKRVVHIWNVDQRMEVRSLRGHLSSVTDVAYAPNGRLIASASLDGVLKIWSARDSGQILFGDTLTAASGYSSDGQWLATAPSFRGVRLWEARTGRLQWRVPSRTQTTFNMVFSPDSRLLYAAGSDRCVRIYRVADGRPAGMLHGHQRAVWAVSCSPDGRYLATGDNGGTIKIWDARTQGEIRSWVAHPAWVNSVVFDCGGRFLVTAGSGRPRVWEVDTGCLVVELDDERGGAWSVGFSPDGRQVVGACLDHQIRVWEIPTGRRIATRTSQTQGASQVSYSPDGLRFSLPVADMGRLGASVPKVEIWDAEHGRVLLSIEAHRESIYSASFDAFGRRLVTASMDTTVRQWEAFPWRDAEYREPKGSSLGERVRHYARAYWRERLAVELNQSAALPMSQEPPLPPGIPEWEKDRWPERDPRAEPIQVNLDRYYTGVLDTWFYPSWNDPEVDDDLSSVPTGLQRMGGVLFDVRGVIWLRPALPFPADPTFRATCHDFPERVDGIAIGRKFRNLHVLHAATTFRWVAANPVKDADARSLVVAGYVLRYADGSHHEHEAIYGRDLRHWWWGNQGDAQEEAERATVAWVGTNPVSERYEAKVRLFLSTFENPNPDVEVVSVDFVSKLTPFAPFLVAMTVEE